jgi:hypothetical protein
MNNPARIAAVALCALLGACDIPAPNPEHKIELKSPPAKVSAERHKGAFAEGAALSTGAELKPLDPSPV